MSEVVVPIGVRVSDGEIVFAAIEAPEAAESPRLDSRAFIAELRELCRRHKIQICTSDYDSLQLWRLNEGDSEVYPDFDDDEQVRG